MSSSPNPADVDEPSAEPTSIAERLSWRTLLAFSAPTVGVGYMFFLVNIYLMKFATDILLVPAAAMGLIFGISRIWDAITDPLAGYLSDRTQSRLGRRRPWLLASILPIGIAFTMLWSPPTSLGPNGLILWMAVGVFLFYSSMTLMIVPHTSLGAELTDNYHDRTRLFGVRHVGWSMGALASVAGMALLIGSMNPRTAAGGMSLTTSVVTGLLLLWAIAGLRERAEYQGRGEKNPYKAYGDVLRNPHARLLLIVFFIESLGAANIGILTPYVSDYIVGAPEKTPLFLLLYLVPSVVSVPIWVRLSRRVGKKLLWVAAMVATGVGFGAMFFLETGDVWWMGSLAAFLGLGAGCGAVVAPSIQADIIDYDEHRTGQRKEGSYFAAWNFVFKLATGLVLMLTGVVLQAAGFVPNIEQGVAAKRTILVLYGLFPMGCYLIGAFLFARFRLGEEEHRRIRADLDARRNGNTVGDPK